MMGVAVGTWEGFLVGAAEIDGTLLGEYDGLLEWEGLKLGSLDGTVLVGGR